ncbi:M48 family metalloprotease [Amphritea balenae]|nr:M48 family metalloprotease [Amphritea balenae]GGK69283.1 putative beta-barrel assembly-enhancing protease [Amphritea balenae]
MFNKYFYSFILGLLLLPYTLTSNASELPVIGNSTSVISLEQEHKLGRTWARMLRGSTPEFGDPIVVNYIDQLIWQLAPYSQLQDLRLELIVLDNPALNAFAVPGGIVGINTGILLGAQDEEELASVIAHELAHLSQRHYAQQLEESRRNTPLLLAGILASILVSSASPDAGIAGISSTIAAGQQAGLNFSRRNEQEADRIGMLNLTSAGYDPFAMPRMFSRIQRSSRFLGEKPPEFLLTHPVTESRIADAENRARQLDKPDFRPLNYDFQLIRKRLEVNYAKDLKQAIKSYKESAADNQLSNYGLALALMRSKQYKQAATALEALAPALQQHLTIKLTYAELALEAGQYTKALSMTEKLRDLYPDSYPVAHFYANSLQANNQFKAAAEVLIRLTKQQPTNSYLWYELAEVEGKAGNTLGIHEARTEYFLLNGQVDKALRQLDFAMRDKQLSDSDIEQLKQRKLEAEAIRDDIKNAF